MSFAGKQSFTNAPLTNILAENAVGVTCFAFCNYEAMFHKCIPTFPGTGTRGLC